MTWVPLADLRSSRSADDGVRRATGGCVRVLTDADTPALTTLVGRDPLADCYVAGALESGRRAGPALGTVILGIDDGPGRLAAAVWAGSNLIPLGFGRAPQDGPAPQDAPAADDDAALTAEDSRALARLLGAGAAALRRRFGSAYGPAHAVLPLARALQPHGHAPRTVRAAQPLMVADARSAVDPDPQVRLGTPEDHDQFLPASVAMFEEELGFSPLRGGGAQYRSRVRMLLSRGRAYLLPEPDPARPVRFKADLGVVCRDVAQIQGVWVRPDLRGQGLAAPAMAAVVADALDRHPLLSLYVNDFNTPALRTYERVGFRRAGTFATVMY